MASRALTDDQLRVELVSYGQNVGPITATTRKVWKKRLDDLKKNAKKATPPRATRRLSSQKKVSLPRNRGISGFSSDESELDLDDDENVSVQEPSRFQPLDYKSMTDRNARRPPSPRKSLRSIKNTSTTDDKIPAPRKTSPKKPSSRYNAFPLYSGGRSQFSSLTAFSDTDTNSSSDELLEAHDLNNSASFSLMSKGINTTPSVDKSHNYVYLDNNATSNHKRTINTPSSSETRKNYTNEFRTKDDDKGYCHPQWISWGLVLSVLAIFIGIGSIYFVNITVQKMETSTMKLQKSLPPALEPEDLCVHTLVEYLSSVAGDAICNSQPGEPRVEIRQARSHTQASASEDNWKKCLSRIINKSTLGVKVFTAEGALAERTEDVRFLESVRPKMSFFCRLQRSFAKLILMFVLLLAVVCCVSVIAMVVRHIKKRKASAQQQLYDLIEEIMDTLRQHAGAHQKNGELTPYLAIPHVRDMLIPPGERKLKKILWESAVAFLDANESRVRTETQVIMGEEFLVWRWLPRVKETKAATSNTNSNTRVWQGQAFNDSVPSAAQYSPTSCLKVRNMFDACVEYGEAWPVSIQDAVLEKCISTCPRAIHHIAVDENSKEGCVYIKCESRESAGQVYKALHGWWFDGKLVTVKYLRPERYLERFPESVNFTHPLNPSNNEMSSVAGLA